MASIKKGVYRYVVPFWFNTEDNGYGKIVSELEQKTDFDTEMISSKDVRWVKSGFWENYKSDKNSQAEMELYPYLTCIFSENDSLRSGKGSNLGESFVINTDGKLFVADYLPDVNKSITFECGNLGLLILKNGVGFVWYEIRFTQKGIDSDDLVAFQYRFKELARTHDNDFRRTVGYDKERKERIYEPFCMGKWLTAFLNVNSLGIRFWAERVNGNTNEVLPDKALLFQYAFADSDDKSEKDKLLFELANGYNESYAVPENLSEIVYAPFGNFTFLITKGGMACVAISKDSNNDFFINQFPAKFIRDYFFMYLLLTYQSFSCLQYSRLLTELPAEEDSFKTDAAHIDKLEMLNNKINLFLVKSVFDSVSSVGHQNSVYRYGKNRLCIENDIRSLTVGLEALRNSERDRRDRDEAEAEAKSDRKIERALTIFGLLAIFSALIDGLSFIDWLNPEKEFRNYWNPGHFVVIGLIVLITVILILTLIKNRRKKNRREN